MLYSIKAQWKEYNNTNMMSTNDGRKDQKSQKDVHIRSSDILSLNEENWVGCWSFRTGQKITFIAEAQTQEKTMLCVMLRVTIGRRRKAPKPGKWLNFISLCLKKCM